MKLHLGCGQNYREGWCNLDAVPTVKADVYHNLEQRPWPFADNSVDEIEMFAVIEHLRDTLAVLGELHRILVPGGTVHVYTGYFKSDDAFLDPTHVAYFHEHTMDFVREGYAYNFYVPFRFEVLSAKLTSQSDTLLKKLRNLLPLRRVLTRFLWNMYDGVDYVLRKPCKA